MTVPISILTAGHYSWGPNCDAWHLLKREDFSVIQERIGAGERETRHFHERSRQFFYVLEGEAQISFEHETVSLGKGEGLEIPPGVQHRLENNSGADVEFLVVSIPESHGDRVSVE